MAGVPSGRDVFEQGGSRYGIRQDGDAATALNMVRERAGIRTLSAGEVSLDRIRNERRVELAYENHRHWDLKRWHIAHIKLADFPTMAALSMVYLGGR